MRAWPCPSVVKALFDFLGVAFVVELQRRERTSLRADWLIVNRMPCLVSWKLWPRSRPIPAVGCGDCLVHLDVEVSKPLDIGGRFIGIVESGVDSSQSFGTT